MSLCGCAARAAQSTACVNCPQAAYQYRATKTHCLTTAGTKAAPHPLQDRQPQLQQQYLAAPRPSSSTRRSSNSRNLSRNLSSSSSSSSEMACSHPQQRQQQQQQQRT